MDVNKLRKKQNRFRFLKTISYLLGYPLFIVLVLVGSMPLFAGSVFTDTKWYGVIAAVAIWLVAIVAQIVISIITKSYNGRTIGMVLVSLILLVGASVVFDMIATKKIDEIAKEYKEYGVEVKSYKYQTGWVATWTSRDGLAKELSNDVNNFCTIYNIGYKSSNYGGENGDGSKYISDKKNDVNYSANGLLADGYVFSFNQAVQILIDYNQSKFDIEHDKVVDENTKEVKYVANGKNVDDELNKALAALDRDPEWINYTKSQEYLEAYGTNGSAYKYMLNEKRVRELISTLGAALGKTNIISAFGDLLKGFGIEPDSLKDLSLETVLDLVNRFELFDEPLTADGLMALLENFSYYQCPNVKPKFAFIKDETLKTYAYANYHATVHGANIGSVLVAKGEDGKIGKVTMSDSGYPNSFAYSLTQLYDLQAREKVANAYYPFMIARRYALVCSGIVALTAILYYVFKRREDDIFHQLVDEVGGRR